MAGYLSAIMAAGANSAPAFTGDSRLDALALEKYVLDTDLNGSGALNVASMFMVRSTLANLASSGSVAAFSKQIYTPAAALQGNSALAGLLYSSYARLAAVNGAGSLAAATRIVERALVTSGFNSTGQLTADTSFTYNPWYSENWDSYPDQNPNWGPGFTFWSGQGGKVTGGAKVPTMGGLGAGSGKAAAIGNVNAVATQDDMAVEWNHMQSLYHGVATNNECVMALRSNAPSSQANLTCVWVVILVNNVSIAFVRNGTETVTSTTGYTIPYGSRLRFSAIDTLFQLRRLDNQELIVGWADGGNTQPRNRRLTFGVTGNYPLFQQQYQSPTFDNVVWGPV